MQIYISHAGPHVQQAVVLEVHFRVEVHVEVAAQVTRSVRGGQAQQVVLGDVHGGRGEGEGEGGGGGGVVVGEVVGGGDVGGGGCGCGSGGCVTAISWWKVGRSHGMPSSDSLGGLARGGIVVL
jgi:hypothetical protein